MMNAGTPKRLPLSEPAVMPSVVTRTESGVSNVVGSSESLPAMTANAIAASVTVRAIGPVLSSNQSSGAMPAILTRPRVGYTPTSALVAAGMRMELPVSVPLPSTAMFAATAVTTPPLEPPGEKRTS